MRPRIVLGTAGVLAPLLLAVMLACGRSPVAPEPPPSCQYTVTPATLSFEGGGGTASLAVQTSAVCAWTTSVQGDWLSTTPGNGTGNGTITVTASSNPADAERTGRVVVAGVTVDVRQAARVTEPCSYTLSPDTQNYSAAGGSGSIAVQTSAGCRWSATVDDPWVALQSTQGEGPGPLQYTVATNDGFASRSTQIRVNDRRAIISQDGRPTGECTYTVVPTTATLHWHHEGLNIQLTTAAGCPWTATAANWIDLDGFTSGSGTTTIVPRMSIYTAETPRTGAVEIRWPTATAGQNVWLTQEGCHYYIDSNATVPAAGGRQAKTLLASPASVDCMVGCPWTATVDVSWIHIANPSGAGDDLLFFDVDANTTGSTRTGVIRIPGRTMTVTQER